MKQKRYIRLELLKFVKAIDFTVCQKNSPIFFGLSKPFNQILANFSAQNGIKDVE